MIDVQCKFTASLCSWCLPQSRGCPRTSCQSAPSCRPTQERTGVRVHGGIRVIPHIKIQSLSAKIMNLLFISTRLPIVTNWYLRENQCHPVPLSYMSNCAGSQFDLDGGSQLWGHCYHNIRNNQDSGAEIIASHMQLYLSQIGNFFEGSKKLKATLKLDEVVQICSIGYIYKRSRSPMHIFLSSTLFLNYPYNTLN